MVITHGIKSNLAWKHLAQHPYNRVRLLSAGVEVSGEKHEYLIPFNKLLDIRCKRGMIWGELEFTLPDEKGAAARYGVAGNAAFYHYLTQAWQQWSAEMSDISAQLTGLIAELQQTEAQDRWLKRSELARMQAKIEEAFSALPMPVARLDGFDNCRDPVSSVYSGCAGRSDADPA